MNAITDSSNATAPVDIVTMRATAVRLLGAEDGREMPPPAPDDLETLTALLRGHLELMISEVEAKAARLPKDSIQRYCALACVGEARRKLSTGATPPLRRRGRSREAPGPRAACAVRPLRGQGSRPTMKTITSLLVYVAAVTAPVLVLVLARMSG